MNYTTFRHWCNVSSSRNRHGNQRNCRKKSTLHCYHITCFVSDVVHTHGGQTIYLNQPLRSRYWIFDMMLNYRNETKICPRRIVSIQTIRTTVHYVYATSRHGNEDSEDAAFNVVHVLYLWLSKHTGRQISNMSTWSPNIVCMWGKVGTTK